MKVVLACDKFRGSLTARQANAAAGAGVCDADPGAALISIPVADGGEGTVDAALAVGFEAVRIMAPGPTGVMGEARIAVGRAASQTVVVVELAEVCGMARLPGGEPAPMTASSMGAGVALRAALDLDPEVIVLAVGGSASSDGGAGLLVGLGAQLWDGDTPIEWVGGADLPRVTRLDLSGLDPRLSDRTVVLASDVDLPLVGLRGSARVFAPQKGASPSQVVTLEAGLRWWADLVAEAVPGADPDRPGSGAAGGVGFAAQCVLKATKRRGIDVVLDLAGFDAALHGVDLVITGEGSFDRQSLSGKAPVGVARRALAAGIPVLVVAGQVTPEAQGWAKSHGIHTAALTEIEPDQAQSVRRAAALVRRLVADHLGKL